jgi:hypothetical protein
MLSYNITHPNNYTQIDFDNVKIDFTVNMRSIIQAVSNSYVYGYSVHQLGASRANNYTNFGNVYYFINDQLINWEGVYEEIHSDIQDFVSASFVLSGDTYVLPRIRMNVWSYHLYNNLSILESVGNGESIEYIKDHVQHLSLPLVNLSLAQVLSYQEDYVKLLDKSDSVFVDLNNTIITLALAGVLMSFAISFDNMNFRRISLIVGVILLLLSIIYFQSALGTFLSIAENRVGIITQTEFVFP